MNVRTVRRAKLATRRAEYRWFTLWLVLGITLYALHVTIGWPA